MVCLGRHLWPWPSPKNNSEKVESFSRRVKIPSMTKPKRKPRKKITAGPAGESTAADAMPNDVFPNSAYTKDPSVAAPDTDAPAGDKQVAPPADMVIPPAEPPRKDADAVLSAPLKYVVSVPEAIEKSQALADKVTEARPELQPQVQQVQQALENLEQAALGNGGGQGATPAAEEKFAVNDPVTISLQDGDYQGVVVMVNESGSYDVTTDQGMTLRSVPASSIIRRAGQAQPQQEQTAMPAPNQQQAMPAASKKRLKANGEEEVDEPQAAEEPGPDDIVIGKDDLSAFYAGKEIVSVTQDEVDEDEDALYKAIAAWMDKSNFKPDVWWISDHGNPNIVTGDVMKFCAAKVRAGLYPDGTEIKVGDIVTYTAKDPTSGEDIQEEGTVKSIAAGENGSLDIDPVKGRSYKQVIFPEDVSEHRTPGAEVTADLKSTPEADEVMSAFATAEALIHSAQMGNAEKALKEGKTPKAMVPYGDRKWLDANRSEIESKVKQTLDGKHYGPEVYKVMEDHNHHFANEVMIGLGLLDKPGEEIKASAFDQVEDLDLGGGFKVRRKGGKKEGAEGTGEEKEKQIEVVDKDGAVIETYPDAFGDDTVSIIKFLRKVLDIKEAKEGEEGGKKDAGEDKGEKKEKKPKAEKKESGEKPGKKAEDKPLAMPNIEGSKSTHNLSPEEKIRLQANADMVVGKVQLCRDLASQLLRQGRIRADQGLIERLQINANATLQEAQRAAGEQAVGRKFTELLAQTNDELILLQRSLVGLGPLEVTATLRSGEIPPLNLSAGAVILPAATGGPGVGDFLASSARRRG